MTDLDAMQAASLLQGMYLQRGLGHQVTVQGSLVTIVSPSGARVQTERDLALRVAQALWEGIDR